MRPELLERPGLQGSFPEVVVRRTSQTYSTAAALQFALDLLCDS
jgi:hypothetical protein